MQRSSITSLQRDSEWSGLHALVVGLGVAGFAAADALIHLGARVTIIDKADSMEGNERATILDILGATIVCGDDTTLPEGVELVVLSPGVSPLAPIVAAARAADRPIWGEIELAWRLREPDAQAPWLAITGTNGKTTTTLMLESILVSSGRRAIAAGNIGRSLVEVVMDPTPWDAIAVEIGAPQLPFVDSMSAQAAVCLNLAPDHIDLFGSFEAYRDAKARVYERAQVAAIYNESDPETLHMVEQAEVIEGCRAIGLTLAIPDISMLGVVDEYLVDRAFLADRRDSALELAEISDLKIPARHNIENALAASALARAHGVDAKHVRAGLKAWEPAAHRIATVAVINDVTYIDDSKATNTHAALTSIKAYESIVWIAGGMAKGQDFEQLVIDAAPRLKGVVLLGVDQELIAQAIERHAPSVPVQRVKDSQPEAMYDVVAKAREMAKSGDTVLLAPGCASWDMYRDYGHRGDMFASAVRALGE